MNGNCENEKRNCGNENRTPKESCIFVNSKKIIVYMKTENSFYESPQTEVLPAETYCPIATSNLENPKEGGEWGWD